MTGTYYRKLCYRCKVKPAGVIRHGEKVGQKPILFADLCVDCVSRICVRCNEGEVFSKYLVISDGKTTILNLCEPCHDEHMKEVLAFGDTIVARRQKRKTDD